VKRLLPVVLSLLIFYNAAGYYCMLYVNHCMQVPGETAVIVLSPETRTDVQWRNAEEFIYANNLYDVVSSHTAGKLIYIHCIRDLSEQELFTALEKSFAKGSLLFSCLSFAPVSARMPTYILSCQHICMPDDYHECMLFSADPFTPPKA
jgi:hypothetical protein